MVNLLAAKAFQEGVITIYNGEQWRPSFMCAMPPAPSSRYWRLRLRWSPASVQRRRLRFNYTLGQIAEKIRKAFPKTRIEYVENEDKRDYRVSFGKVRSRLSFQCSTTIDEGIAECVVHFPTSEWVTIGKSSTQCSRIKVFQPRDLEQERDRRRCYGGVR